MYENSMASYHKDLIEIVVAHGRNLADVKNGNKKDTKLTHVWVFNDINSITKTY
jgi:hypothetical protein